MIHRIPRARCLLTTNHSPLVTPSIHRNPRVPCLVAAILIAGLASAASAAEIGYVEDFALARDRAAALKQLIPGTEDYYYYHCLHLQNTRQFDKVDDLLQVWIKRHN